MTPQQLKNSILQYAIQGKLVEQRAEEGTAEELYAKIQEEKQKLIKEGKLKKEKPLAPITDKEIPFDIPKSWKWCRLSSVSSEIGDGLHGTPVYDADGDVFFINGNNLKNGNIHIYENTKRVTSEEAKKYIKKLSFSTILISINGTLGNVAFYNNENIILGKSACYFNLLGNINKLYIKFLIESFYFCRYLEKSATGTTISNVPLSAIRKVLIPLPPLGEQKRIVAKIEELMALADKYADSYLQLEALNKKFPADIQKSILQYAIQGKLVEQRTEEGTAEDLYAQIQEEKQKLIKEGKLKKEKPLAPITDKEIPFDIPESWKWVRLKDICSKIVDGDHNPPTGSSSPTEYMMLSAQNINNNALSSLDKVRYLSKEVFDKEYERTSAVDGDIFFTIVGTLGRSCIYQGGYNLCFQRSVSVITTLSYNYYVKYFLDSQYIQNLMVKNSTGTAQKGFYLNQVNNIIIPLPPLAEQKRIVAKIEELMAIVKKLE